VAFVYRKAHLYGRRSELQSAVVGSDLLTELLAFHILAHQEAREVGRRIPVQRQLYSALETTRGRNAVSGDLLSPELGIAMLADNLVATQLKRRSDGRRIREVLA
jgi:hypothetical protein